MRRVSLTEMQNNFGNFLLLAQEQDIIVTRNGKDVAKLSGLNYRNNLVSEETLSSGYGLRKATYEEFLELSLNSEKRYEDDINVVQPDLMVICDLQEKLGDDGYYHGVPDLIVEIISDSTKRNDLIKKMNLYLDGGVKEYWVVDPEAKQITIYQFKDLEISNNTTFLQNQEVVSFIFPKLKINLRTVFL